MRKSASFALSSASVVFNFGPLDFNVTSLLITVESDGAVAATLNVAASVLDRPVDSLVEVLGGDPQFLGVSGNLSIPLGLTGDGVSQFVLGIDVRRRKGKYLAVALSESAGDNILGTISAL